MAFDATLQRHSCNDCSGPKNCLGRQYCAHGPENQVVRSSLQAGQTLFRTGDSVNGIYVLKSGALKSYVTTADGEEQILAFYSPGDVVGYDGITGGRHSRNIVALSPAVICRMPTESLVSACGFGNGIQESLLDGMGREILRLQGMLRLERLSADQKMVLFLLNQARRQGKSGDADGATVVSLPMSRGEIGRFLDLATETVSRCLTRLQASGHIRINRNEIELLDSAGLQQLSRAPAETRKRAAA